jgi:hypothetical protein
MLPSLMVTGVLLSAGLSCFQGHTPGGGTGCDGAPLLPVLYVSMNLAYNISLLNLLRSAGKQVPHKPGADRSHVDLYCKPV